jgi:hypothetical protein
LVLVLSTNSEQLTELLILLLLDKIPCMFLIRFPGSGGG